MTPPAWRCPACRGALVQQGEAFRCGSCDRTYPILFGIPDFRLEGDRYLSLEADRERAAELENAARGGLSFDELLAFYWRQTAGTPASIAARHVAGVQRAAEESGAILQTLGGGRLLDLGCGAGGSLLAAARSGTFPEIAGVDSALRWLVLARLRLSEAGIPDVWLAAAGADMLPFSDGAFDAVLMRHLLEHVRNPAATVQAAARVLAPGGRLGIETFHRWAPIPEPHVGLLGVAWLPRRLQRGYVRWRTGDDYSAVRLPSRREVLAAIRRAKLRVEGLLHLPVTPGQRAALSPRLRAMLPLYEALGRGRLGRMLRSRLDPVLRLTAVKSKP